MRCEKPAIRVLYAIVNGGFSGAYMPQNVVVGEQAREVANFVARYAGRQAPVEPGVTPCVDKSTDPPPLTGPLNLSAVRPVASPSACGWAFISVRENACSTSG